ncbi:MAG: IS21 family transposase [Candidatus Brocadiales bacterium]|nr:IS21 family transposase [Candidatus Brocadiales bacterium]
MKGWRMIHKIKALHDEGNGYSRRQIGRELSISRNTVKKYLAMSEEQINEMLGNQEREKHLDKYREYIVHQLQKYPKLKALKIKRKIETLAGKEVASERTFRRYVSNLKKRIPVKQERYYEPVIDMLPGAQCQVDLGELRGVIIGGMAKTVYFAVYVLSYSRLMHVVVSEKPINTKIFINMHDEAFSIFDGVVEECVYDQTKLVAIKEEYREVWFNEEFYRYATFAGFDSRVCEGYDPESKGKVEAGVRYVKESFFYGEEFCSFDDLKDRLSDWLKDVANSRIHGTTKKIPQEVYVSEEIKKLRPYLRPSVVLDNLDLEKRGVDKTSLISYKSNKYSVPMPWQSSIVGITEEGNLLLIRDLESKDVIARHNICELKGKIIKNINHYRDHEKLVSDREDEVTGVIGKELSEKLCRVLKTTSPKIYKDQLTGLIKVLKQYVDMEDMMEILTMLSDRPRLRVSFMRDYLEAFKCNRETYVIEEVEPASIVSLAVYDNLTSASLLVEGGQLV